MTAAAPILSVRDLAVHFALRGGLPLVGAPPRIVRAVDGVSLDLMPGETLGLVGESGCGKSTLGRALLQLVEPTAGTIVWLGSDVAQFDREALRRSRRDRQIVFQDPFDSLNPRMTIGEIVAEPLRTFSPGLRRGEVRARVAAMMEKVGLLPQQINRYPHEFSGGQCQRVGIARAMINDPKLLVCDEPVSSLDVSIQAQIVNLLMDLQRSTGMAMIFISHNLSIVRHISHRIMVLYLGKVMEVADRDAIWRAPRHPYTQALVSAVPLPDPALERSRARILLSGDLPSPIDPPSGCVFRTRCPIAKEVCARLVPAPDPVAPDHRVACHFRDETGARNR
jgi:oligopeptide transport system ATP-binding protein